MSKMRLKIHFSAEIEFIKNSINTFLNFHMVSIYSDVSVPNSKMTKLF